MDINVTQQTKQMIDGLKAVCANYGLGNAASEYKIITEVFLYKFLNDKFLFEAKQVEPAFAQLSPAEVEEKLAAMDDDAYELFLMGFGADTAKLKQTQLISFLFNRRNEDKFHDLFDQTLIAIANDNIEVFSVKTGGQSKMRLFSGISQHVLEIEQKDGFCRAIIDKLAESSFDSVFEEKYDFFAQIFEYLIKDYNKDFGKYAEYYTPHTIASVMLMDASKLGTKVKVDGKNQRTVLSQDEIDRIINTFKAGEPVDDFCVAVSYEDIEAKKYSFSAGQYFEVKIDYVELTPEEFDENSQISAIGSFPCS